MLWQLPSTLESCSGVFIRVLLWNQGEENSGCRGKVDYCGRNKEVTQQKSSHSVLQIQVLNPMCRSTCFHSWTIIRLYMCQLQFPANACGLICFVWHSVKQKYSSHLLKTKALWEKSAFSHVKPTNQRTNLTTHGKPIVIVHIWSFSTCDVASPPCSTSPFGTRKMKTDNIKEDDGSTEEFLWGDDKDTNSNHTFKR